MLVNTKQLQNALKNLDSIILNKPQLVILGGVKLKVEGQELILTTSDLKNTVNVTLEIESGEIEDIVALGVKDILKSIKFFKFHNTRIFIEDSVVKFENGSKTIISHTMPAAEFPKGLNMEVVEHSYMYNECDLYNRLKTVDYAKSKEDTRPFLKGIYFNDSDIVAVDGYRVVVDSNADLSVEKPFIINPEAVKSILKVLNRKLTDLKVKIKTSENIASFKFGNTEITSSLLKGDYFRYKDLINGDNTSIDLNKKEFEDNIKFLHVYSAGTKHNLLELMLERGK